MVVTYSDADWNTSLCDCFQDLPLCLLAWFLPCVPSGRNLAWVRRDKKDSGLYMFIVWISRYFCCCCCIEFYNRTMLRQKFGIDGTRTHDCLTAYLCFACALQQHARQIGCRGCSGPTEPER
eukprot:EG_transcript_11569